jgi:YggT family protein
MRQSCSTNGAAMAIPGYGVAEQVFVGGFMQFLSIYNIVITARVLLSWFPQAQSIGLLQPVFQITDPYLNLFRGLIPPIFGLDLSPLLAFFLLSALTNATAAVGAEITPEMRKKMSKKYNPFGKKQSGPYSFAP